MNEVTEGIVFTEADKKEVDIFPLNEEMAILALQDLDATTIMLPSLRQTKMLGLYKAGGEIVPMRVEGQFLERLDYALTVLKLPALVAVRIAETDEDLDNFPKPEVGTLPTVAFGIAGEASLEVGGKGVGKSLLAAVLALRQGLPVVSLENKYGFSAKTYAERIKTALGTNFTFSQAIEVVDDLWEEQGGKKSLLPGTVPKPLSQTLAGAVDFFRGTAERPEIMLFDLPGVPRPPRKDGGSIQGFKRPVDLYDLVGFMSLEAGSASSFTTRQLTAQQMERKVGSLAELINGNLPKMRETWSRFSQSVGSKVED